jgi:anaerobic selenocysteine-containing dehydrogenase
MKSATSSERWKSCARAQAALNRLYNPDRIKGPLKRRGARGSGEFDPVSWDEAINTVASRISDLIVQGKNKNILWLDEDDRPSVLHSLIDRVLRTIGGPSAVSCNPFSREIERAAAQASLGSSSLPSVDLSSADCVLSFGARFLETWDSPVFHARGFSEMRSKGAGRHHLIHAEPRMSMTAANADLWLPVKPGSEGFLALAIAAEVLKLEGKGSPFELDKQALESTGIPYAKIARVASELKQAKTAVVIGAESAGAHQNGLFNLQAIYYLSSLLNHEHSATRVPTSTESQAGSPSPGPGQLSSVLAQTQLLFVRHANPVYSTPRSFKIRDTINSIPFIVSFSSFEDETTALADLILPDHSPYESWNDFTDATHTRGNIVTISKPVIDPLYETKHTGDVLLAIASKVPALASQSTGETFRTGAESP